MKTIKDVLKALNLSEGSRDRIIKKITKTYHIVPCSENKKYFFTEDDFNMIITSESAHRVIVHSNPSDFDVKKLDIYYLNKDRGLYPRLTEYGGSGMKDPYNIGETLSELTKNDIDRLLNPFMVGVYRGILIKLKSGENLKYEIPVVVSCSNGKYIIDDGFMIEVVPVDEVEDYEGEL